jgi:transposase
MGTDRRKDSDTGRHTPSHKDEADTLRRVEVITGAGRRRRWSAEAKAAIVAESCEPGTSVSVVARRHDISPSLLFLWRRQMRTNNCDTGLDRTDEAVFVPVRVANAGSSESREASNIEIEVGDIRIRVAGRVDRSLLRDVLSAARVASR